MLKWLFTLFVALVVSLYAIKGQSAEKTPGSAAELTVTVDGLRNDQGLLRLAIYNNPEDFPEGKDTGDADVPIKAGVAVAKFMRLIPGRYAIAVHHDENGNKDMDTFLGFPLEGFGFSNNAKAGISGPPDFEEASFDVGAADTAIRLTIVYWASP
ncbi:MAG: DUF2141 domain-containing protein [Rhodospirillaceae bacterium]|jgi:uncharacterized protein (DUF2141 family)